MPRVFVPSELLTAEEPCLTGDLAKRLVRVMRLGEGDCFQAIDGSGLEYVCRVRSATAKQVHFTVEESHPLETEPALELTLAQSIPKGQRMELVIQKAVELGVRRLIPLIAERGVVRPVEETDDDGDEAPGQRERRWSLIAISAAEQSGRALIPEVTRPMSLGSALAEVGDSVIFILDERERDLSLRQALQSSILNPPSSIRVALFIGPEGGFTTGEIEHAVSAGAQSVTLGPRILRSETAGIVACALTLSAAGELEFR